MSTRRRQQRHSDDNGANPNSHLIGTTASVIQKHDQGTGHLTSGTIAEILTNSRFHPRGIKVRLDDGTVGRISSDSTGGTTDRGSCGLYSNDDADAAAAAPKRSRTLADYMTDEISAPRGSRKGGGAAVVAPPVHERQREEYQRRPEHRSEDRHEHPNVAWSCSGCTFVNSGLMPECELCQTIRHG